MTDVKVYCQGPQLVMVLSQGMWHDLLMVDISFVS